MYIAQLRGEGWAGAAEGGGRGRKPGEVELLAAGRRGGRAPAAGAASSGMVIIRLLNVSLGSAFRRKAGCCRRWNKLAGSGAK